MRRVEEEGGEGGEEEGGEREGREEALVRFQRRWREHFLVTMKPEHLPDLWCVDHNPYQ